MCPVNMAAATWILAVGGTTLLAAAESEPISEHLISPIVQGGFAAFSGVLLLLVYWLCKQLLLVIKEATIVIDRNTEAIKTIGITTDNAIKTLQAIQIDARRDHEKILQRIEEINEKVQGMYSIMTTERVAKKPILKDPDV